MEALADWLAECTHDPLKFVLEGFPWGEPGELADQDGPDIWQRDHLRTIGARLRDNPSTPIQEAIASGHGIGKSADAAWLILWAISTHEMSRGVVTANTENQLRTKTWAELAKWHRLFIGRHLFKFNATSIHAADPAHEKEWRIDAIPWSERNTEAFAGLHNKGKRVFCLYDEASAIPDIIWEVTEGALTDEETEILWLVRGNPTRNTGRFRECFGRNRHRWITHQIDSRSSRLTNKEQISRWIEDYGEDSDFARVRVRGVFPRAGSMQLIPADIVEQARKRVAEGLVSDPVVLGVDVARHGDDQSVICIRQGRDAKSRPWRRYRNLNTMQLASEVHRVACEVRADAVFVDATGIGWGVVDRLEQLQMPHGCIVYPVEFGSKPDAQWSGDKARMAYKVDEMWWNMAQWLRKGAIPDEQEIEDDLVGREYGYTTDNAIRLEKKDDMKKRGLASPDNADALALTFAYAVAPRVAEMEQSERAQRRHMRSRDRATGY
jgi:hypothetical protein